MLKTNDNLINDSCIFFHQDSCLTQSIIVAQSILNTLYIDAPYEMRKQIAKECYDNAKRCMLKEYTFIDLAEAMCNLESYLDKNFNFLQYSPEVIEMTEKILSFSSFSELNEQKDNLRSENMTIIGIVFTLIVLAVMWHFFIRSRNETLIKAEKLLQRAILSNSQNRSWCNKIIKTFCEKNWNWSTGISKAALSSDEQNAFIEYFLSNGTTLNVRKLTADRGESFNATTMKSKGETLPFVYKTLEPGIIIDDNVVVKCTVSTASADFITVEQIADEKLLNYCKNADFDSFNLKKITFSLNFCDAMPIVFKDSLQDLLCKICSASCDKSLVQTNILPGESFDMNTMEAEELNIPERAVVATVIFQGLMRDNKLILKPRVTVKGEI